MAGAIQALKISELVNYYENPRHAIGSSEEDTLKKLFDAVGIQYMLNLAEDVQRNGLLGNQQIVVVYSETIHKYVVYEGNRRVAAIKLLLAPEHFGFLDRATIEKAKKIRQQGEIPDVINCYITNEEEAFFIMERLHSGEDKGRGTKQWTPREKEVFKVRQSHEKNLSYLIDFYVKKYFDGFDITTILPFTTIQRIFNNREVKKEIGLDIANESSFTSARMQLIIDASKWIVSEAEAADAAVTRLFNKARVIEDKLIPWIQEYTHGKSMDDNSAGEQSKPVDTDGQSDADKADNNPTNTGSNFTGSGAATSVGGESDRQQDDGTTGSSVNGRKGNFGGSRNLPYFFQGLNYSSLNPNDAETHGAVNGATALRQAGSTLKPFMYAYLFDKGESPASVIADIKTHINSPGGDYIPENFDHKYRGPVTIRDALANSLNIPAVKWLARYSIKDFQNILLKQVLLRSYYIPYFL